MLILICDAFDASMPEKLARFGEVTSDNSRLAEATVALVRSKTKCTKEWIDQAPNLKVIIRGGVGTDNIDKTYAILVNGTQKSTATASTQQASPQGMQQPGGSGTAGTTRNGAARPSR